MMTGGVVWGGVGGCGGCRWRLRGGVGGRCKGRGGWGPLLQLPLCAGMRALRRGCCPAADSWIMPGPLTRCSHLPPCCCCRPVRPPLQARRCRTTWASCRTCSTSYCPQCLRPRGLRTWRRCCRWVGCVRGGGDGCGGCSAPGTCLPASLPAFALLDSPRVCVLTRHLALLGCAALRCAVCGDGVCAQGDDDEIAKLTERMKSLLGPFVLRRLKAEVAGQLTTKSHAVGA